MWPYSYDTCDLGTFPDQMYRNGTPSVSIGLSGLPGQKLSACTCPGSDHPGPNVGVGRGVPEIDIIEGRVNTSLGIGEASQSFQIAPYEQDQSWNELETTIYDNTTTTYNPYKGGPLQESLSALTFVDNQFYDGDAFTTWGYEYWSDPKHRSDGYITWYYNGQKTWTINAAAIGPDNQTGVNQRLIPEEPMVCFLSFFFAIILH